MTISYPVTPPTSPIHSQIDWALESVVAVSESPFSLVSQVQQHAGERWLISVNMPPMERAQAAPWIAFLNKLRGRRGTFYYGSYLMRSPQGLGGGTPLVNGAGQSGYVLNVDGCTPSAQFLKAGDFFQIDNSLYQNLTDATANGSGQVALDIRPRLRTHADNSVVDLTSPQGIFRLVDNRSGWSEGNSQKYIVSFIGEEAL